MKQAIVIKEVQTSFSRFLIGEVVFAKECTSNREKCTVRNQAGTRIIVGIPKNHLYFIS
jgi:hypothetical protein